MPVQVPANVQQSITALKDDLRAKFMSPTRVNYDDRKQTVSVVFSGSDDGGKPESIANLDMYREKVGKFEKLLGRKKLGAEKAVSAQIPVEYEGRSFTASSTSFALDIAALESLATKARKR